MEECSMKYIIYWNQTNKHVYIHTSHCSSVRQHGGERLTGQGGYSESNTYSETCTKANAEAERIGVVARDRLKCAPATATAID